MLCRNGVNWRQPIPSLSPAAPRTSSSNSTTSKSKQFSVRSSASSPKWRKSRQSVSISLFLSHFLLTPNYATAGSFLDKYVKKKKLDPLEVYVPAVILTQLQIKDLEKTLEVDDKPEYATCRSLLRSGPAASLRVNIRAVAQYASDAGNGENAFKDVDQCLRALEELDSLMLHASRNEPDASVKAMKAHIGTALSALDSLLQTVPTDVLTQGKEIADAYRATDNVFKQPRDLDPEMTQLESIL
ncbi:hypothetical protein F3Y22_tig00111013pilonHSYRG00205 [Hibiscus syriacus]|uniref:DUF7880 domain-containing protein n=1 Tax=Hibiscus syriacus TaxID=106335 RepID=A0A6A2Z7R5_HIBSY|nr:uncharacterized protein LOC120149921 [Hibiscus syriacus]KAE8687596.1 hypothetical protein F3Y22_tig00111013pilonHSYRG00205 [Hibiscus syriacus]